MCPCRPCPNFGGKKKLLGDGSYEASVVKVSSFTEKEASGVTARRGGRTMEREGGVGVTLISVFSW